MIYSDFPITLFTACLLGIIYVILCINVIRARFKSKIAIGHDDQKLRRSYRAQANFIEYVPILLILLALLENANISSFYLLTISIVIVCARILHPLGYLNGNSVNIFRKIGAGLTLLALIVMSITGLYLILLG